MASALPQRSSAGLIKSPGPTNYRLGGSKTEGTAEQKLVEIFENQRWSSAAQQWKPASECPEWTAKDGSSSKSLDECPVPEGCQWITNWRIDWSTVDGGALDRSGWEYATCFERFTPTRIPRGDIKWSDRARRRKWIRCFASKTDKQRSSSTGASELLPRVQEGLEGLVKGRKMIQMMVNALGTDKDTNELRKKLWNLVGMVRQHVRELEIMFKTSEKDTAIKKLLRNFQQEHQRIHDVIKEAERKEKHHVVESLISSADPGYFSDESAEAQALPAVTAGRGVFQPASFDSSTSVSFTGAVEDGVYVPRDVQDRMLLRQMKVQNEYEVNEILISERAETILEINHAMVELREVFLDFARLAHEQQSMIDRIADNIDETHGRVRAGYNHIVEANRLHQELKCLIS